MAVTPQIALKVSSEEDVKKLLLQVKPEWKPESIEVITMKGGMANAMYRANHGNEQVLIRAFAGKIDVEKLPPEDQDFADKMYDRPFEIRILTELSKRRLSPPVYATFENGVCYGFAPGATVTPEVVRQDSVYPKIAALLANYHSLCLRGRKEDDVSGKPRPNGIKDFTNVLEFFEGVEDKLKEDPNYAEIIKLAGNVKEETEWLLTLFPKEEESVVVLGHNDLNLGNIVYDPESGVVTLIDFELAKLNFQASDIAVHFTQFGGNFGPDIVYQADLFPEEDLQKKWIKCYLKAYRELNPTHAAKIDFESDFQRLFQEVRRLVLVAQYREGVILAAIGKQGFIPEDHVLPTSKARLRHYWQLKQQFLSRK